MTLLGGSSIQVSARDLREPKDRPRLWDPDEKDFNNILSPKLLFGDQGKGKGVAEAFILTELYDNPPECIGGRPKIIMFDVLGRLELACGFEKMRRDNPLYHILSHQRNELPNGEDETTTELDGSEHVGVNPRGYNVEVRMPLTWAFNRPDLDYRQPIMVKPFVLAIDDQMPNDWAIMLGISEDHRASYLHNKVLEKGTREGWLPNATPERLTAEAEMLTRAKKAGKHTFTQKQVQTLTGPYDRLGAQRIVMPKRLPWDEDRSLPWLDMKAVLEDVDTITIFRLDFAVSRSAAAHLMAVLLNRIIYLKDKNNRQRVKNAIVVSVPDISMVAAPSYDSKQQFMEAVKENLLWMFSKGTGSQICVVADSQDPEDIDKAILGKGTAVGLFKLERDKIRDIFKNMVVANKEDMLETETLQKLESAGFFIWKGTGSPEAELIYGAIPRFEYPRHKIGALSDFTYVDLWRLVYPPSSHPDMWYSIEPLYHIVESMRRFTMNEAIASLPDDDGSKKDEKKADFGPETLARIKALMDAYPGKGKAVLGVRDLARILEKAQAVPADKLHLADAHAKKVLVKMERRGFAHGEIDTTYGKRWLYTVELGRLRKALEADAQQVLTTERSEAAKKVAELGDRLKLAFLEGDTDEAGRLSIELVSLASANKDDKAVEAVMVGFMGSQLPLTPELKAWLASKGKAA